MIATLPSSFKVVIRSNSDKSVDSAGSSDPFDPDHDGNSGFIFGRGGESGEFGIYGKEGGDLVK